MLAIDCQNKTFSDLIWFEISFLILRWTRSTIDCSDILRIYFEWSIRRRKSAGQAFPSSHNFLPFSIWAFVIHHTSYTIIHIEHIFHTSFLCSIQTNIWRSCFFISLIFGGKSRTLFHIWKCFSTNSIVSVMHTGIHSILSHSSNMHWKTWMRSVWGASPFQLSTISNQFSCFSSTNTCALLSTHTHFNAYTYKAFYARKRGCLTFTMNEFSAHSIAMCAKLSGYHRMKGEYRKQREKENKIEKSKLRTKEKRAISFLFFFGWIEWFTSQLSI